MYTIPNHPACYSTKLQREVWVSPHYTADRKEQTKVTYVHETDGVVRQYFYDVDEATRKLGIVLPKPKRKTK